MKTVVLVRHGKASHDELSMPDIQRQLTNEGRKRTRRIAHYLAGKKISVEKIITSPAVRAFETAKILACELEIDPASFIIEKSVYEAHPDDIFDILFALPDEISKVMIVGHNPSLEVFAHRFMEAPVEALPTTGVVSLKFVTEKWTDIALSKVLLDFVIFPSMIK